MSAEAKKRRRSSLCANRISLLPSEVTVTKDSEENIINADKSEIVVPIHPNQDLLENIFDKINPIIESKIHKLNEEYLAWDVLLEKYSKDAYDGEHLQETMNYDDIPDVVKKKASMFMTSTFLYDEVLQNCEKLVESTLLYAENFVQKVTFLEKTQKNISNFLDKQTSQLNSKVVKDNPNMNRDIRHLIENRISIISPTMSGK